MWPCLRPDRSPCTDVTAHFPTAAKKRARQGKSAGGYRSSGRRRRAEGSAGSGDACFEEETAYFGHNVVKGSENAQPSRDGLL